MVFVADVVNTSRQLSVTVIQFHRTVTVSSIEMDQAAFDLFERDAGMTMPFLVALNPRFGTMQQLFGSQAGDND